MKNQRFKIFGIIYGDKITEYTPYYNNATEKLWRFENNALIDIIENRINGMADDSYLGIFSWRFLEKTQIKKASLAEKLFHAASADVYNLSPRFGKHIHFMNWSDEGHKGIKDMIQRCCSHAGLTYNNDCEHIIYASQFITRKDIYTDYVRSIIMPCLELLEGEMWNEVNVDAGYTRAMPNLKEVTGLDFYNYIPFILERMFMQYVDNKQLIVNQLI